MTNERRYREDEIAEIFEVATDDAAAGGRARTAREGLTLPELQEIGREVGLAPDRIADAASALDLRRSAPATKRFLGVPITVGRTVELPRAPTDREWEILVSEIRDTFEARGELESHGNLRQWSNGNLHVCVEPTEQGFRLRMGSLKESVRGFGVMGAVMILMSIFIGFALASKGRFLDEIFLPFFMFAIGGGAVTVGALSLPGWRRERSDQMEYLGARALELTGAPPEGEGGRFVEGDLEPGK